MNGGLQASAVSLMPNQLPEAQPRRWLGPLVALLSTLLTLILSEGICRLVLPPPTSLVEVAVGGSTPRLQQENAEPLVAQEAGFDGMVARGGGSVRRVLRANAHVLLRNHGLSHRDIPLRTNELGFRNPPLGDKSRPRVLFLGDSITMADYLYEEETFVRRVETLVGRRRAPLRSG